MRLDPKFQNLKYVVTHGGYAHMDDILSVAFSLIFTARGRDSELMGINPYGYEFPPVYRRDPTEEELNDPQVLVLDVGGRHEPELMNFDHHGLDGEAPPTCTLTLLSRYMGFEEDLRATRWFTTLEFVDDRGPTAWAELKKLKQFPYELSSPMDEAMKKRFEQFFWDKDKKKDIPIAEEFLSELHVYARLILDQMESFEANYEKIKKEMEMVEVDGITGIWYTKEKCDVAALNKVRNSISTEKNPVGFSVTLDDRAGGLTLFRFNDDPRLNFKKLEKEALVSFVHKHEFIAKTRCLLTKEETLALVKLAIVKTKK